MAGPRRKSKRLQAEDMNRDGRWSQGLHRRSPHVPHPQQMCWAHITRLLGIPAPCGERQHRDVIKQTRVTSLPGSSPTWLVESDQLGDASPWPPCQQQLLNPAEGNVGVACSRQRRSDVHVLLSAVRQREARSSPCCDSSPSL